MSTHLPGVFGAVAPLLDSYGYLAVGGLILIEDFGVPAPGETILIAAGLYAGAGRLNILAVAVIAFVAAAGDNIGFAIGHFGGRRLALRYGKYVLLTEQRLDRAEAVFTRHGGKIVVIARFIEGLRQLNGIIAGISDMPWRRFLPFNPLGAALWVALCVTLGDPHHRHLRHRPPLPDLPTRRRRGRHRPRHRATPAPPGGEPALGQLPDGASWSNPSARRPLGGKGARPRRATTSPDASHIAY